MSKYMNLIGVKKFSIITDYVTFNILNDFTH